MYNNINKILKEIKDRKPLIVNLTNDVTMDFIANGLLSLGASPIMTKSLSEIYDLVKIANAIVINIGTLNDEFIKLCEQTCRIANQLEKPIIFDPVGAGASQYRTQTCLNFLEKFKFSILRGNASEMMALYGKQPNAKGVDASMTTTEVIDAAKLLSLAHNTVIVISGKTDAVIKGDKLSLFERGSPLMPLITGSGCLLTSVIASFNAVSQDPYTAACAAVVFYTVCGERAAAKAVGPGSFKSYFLDNLFNPPERGDYEKQ